METYQVEKNAQSKDFFEKQQKIKIEETSNHIVMLMAKLFFYLIES